MEVELQIVECQLASISWSPSVHGSLYYHISTFMYVWVHVQSVFFCFVFLFFSHNVRFEACIIMSYTSVDSFSCIYATREKMLPKTLFCKVSMQIVAFNSATLINYSFTLRPLWSFLLSAWENKPRLGCCQQIFLQSGNTVLCTYIAKTCVLQHKSCALFTLHSCMVIVMYTFSNS